MTARILSPNYSPGRPYGPIRWVVWHSTEGQENSAAASALARNWFGVAKSQVSAHLVADASGCIECVLPGDRAWHCGPKGNPFGYGVEIVGLAGQTRDQWRDAYSLAAIRNACDVVRAMPELDHIPAAFLSDDELRSGRSGHITHAQVSRVLGGTNHTDPGPNFPLDYVAAHLAGEPAPALPSPVDPGTFPRLAYGDEGPAVRHLQEFMVRVFGSYNRYAPTGKYLDLTAAGIAEFQRRTGITGPDADGRTVGPRTNRMLAEYGYRP